MRKLFCLCAFSLFYFVIFRSMFQPPHFTLSSQRHHHLKSKNEKENFSIEKKGKREDWIYLKKFIICCFTFFALELTPKSSLNNFKLNKVKLSQFIEYFRNFSIFLTNLFKNYNYICKIFSFLQLFIKSFTPCFNSHLKKICEASKIFSLTKHEKNGVEKLFVNSLDSTFGLM